MTSTSTTITITLRPTPAAGPKPEYLVRFTAEGQWPTPIEMRLRLFLKTALRQFGLRCRSILPVVRCCASCGAVLLPADIAGFSPRRPRASFCEACSIKEPAA